MTADQIEQLSVAHFQIAVRRIYLCIPAAAQEEAVKQVARIASPDLLANNEAFHRSFPLA